MANQIKAVTRLAELRRLPAGWDYGRGGPISGSAYASARLLLHTLDGLGAKSFDVVPGEDGGVVVAAYRGDKSAEIHCLSDGGFELLHEEGDKHGVIQTGLSLEGIICALEGYGWRSPKFYASCTRNAIFRESDGIAVWHFAIPAMAAGSPSYALTASKNGAWVLVNTSENFTQRGSAETHQSSGEFQSLPWEEVLA